MSKCPSLMDFHSLVCCCCLSCQSLRLPLWTLPPPLPPASNPASTPAPPSCHSYGHSFPPSMWHPLLLPSLEAGRQKEGWSLRGAQAVANAYKPNHPICSVDHSAKGNLPQTHPSLYENTRCRAASSLTSYAMIMLLRIVVMCKMKTCWSRI